MTLRDARRIVDEFIDRYIFRITIAALVAALFFLFFADRIVVTIPAGHAGVLWKRFGGGTLIDRIYGEGLRLIMPWNTMTLYDLRYQTIDTDVVAVDSAGLRMELKVSTRIRLNPARVGHLHKFVGPDYVNVIVVPEVGTHTRAAAAHYTAEEVYSTKREAIQQEALRRVRAEISVKGQGQNEDFDFIEVEDVLLREIVLPALVASAIEEKVRQFHMDQEWVFRLQREAKESQRKAIEAEGIRKFQEIVTRGISDSYLKWKGIDATLKLAESSNAKIVIIGSGPQGLPIILGNEPARAPGPAGPTSRADVPSESQPAHSGQDGPRGASPSQAAAPSSATAPVVPPPSAPAPPSTRATTPSGPATAAQTTAPAPPPVPERGVVRGFFDRILGLVW